MANLDGTFTTERSSQHSTTITMTGLIFQLVAIVLLLEVAGGGLSDVTVHVSPVTRVTMNGKCYPVTTIMLSIEDLRARTK